MRILIAGAVDVAPEKREQALKEAKQLIDAALAEKVASNIPGRPT